MVEKVFDGSAEKSPWCSNHPSHDDKAQEQHRSDNIVIAKFVVDGHSRHSLMRLSGVIVICHQFPHFGCEKFPIFCFVCAIGRHRKPLLNLFLRLWWRREQRKSPMKLSFQRRVCWLHRQTRGIIKVAHPRCGRCAGRNRRKTVDGHAENNQCLTKEKRRLSQNCLDSVQRLVSKLKVFTLLV